MNRALFVTAVIFVSNSFGVIAASPSAREKVNLSLSNAVFVIEGALQKTSGMQMEWLILRVSKLIRPMNCAVDVNNGLLASKRGFGNRSSWKRIKFQQRDCVVVRSYIATEGLVLFVDYIRGPTLNFRGFQWCKKNTLVGNANIGCRTVAFVFNRHIRRKTKLSIKFAQPKFDLTHGKISLYLFLADPLRFSDAAPRFNPSEKQ